MDLAVGRHWWTVGCSGVDVAVAPAGFDPFGVALAPVGDPNTKKSRFCGAWASTICISEHIGFVRSGWPPMSDWTCPTKEVVGTWLGVRSALEGPW